MEFIVDIFNLVNMVIMVGKFVSMVWCKFNICMLFNFFMEVIYVNVFKGVFGFCIFMIYMVILVMLCSYNCFSNS